MEELEKLKEKFSGLVKEVRGKGLMLGMEITTDGDAVVKACLEKGFLINCTAGNVLRFIPPLIVRRNDIDHLINILNGIFSRLD